MFLTGCDGSSRRCYWTEYPHRHIHIYTKASVFLLNLILLSSVTHKHTNKIIHNHKLLLKLGFSGIIYATSGSPFFSCLYFVYEIQERPAQSHLKRRNFIHQRYICYYRVPVLECVTPYSENIISRVTISEMIKYFCLPDISVKYKII